MAECTEYSVYDVVLQLQPTAVTSNSNFLHLQYNTLYVFYTSTLYFRACCIGATCQSAKLASEPLSC